MTDQPTRREALEALRTLQHHAHQGAADHEKAYAEEAYLDARRWILNSTPVPEGMTLTESDAKQQIDAAELVAGLYFDIAAEVLGEDEVRRRRDDRICDMAAPTPEDRND